MRETGIGTSLMLIALGAVLAFAVTLRTTGIDIQAVGVILMVVGLLGLIISYAAFGSLFADTAGDIGHRHVRHDLDYYESQPTQPHEHRRVETKDVVYEDEQGPRVEGERRILRD